MKKIIGLFVIIAFLTVTNVIGQIDTTFRPWENRVFQIDSLVSLINTLDIDSTIFDEQFGLTVNNDTIEKLIIKSFQDLTKYQIKTTNTGSFMSIKTIDIVEYENATIYAIEYYSVNKDFWISYYYHDNIEIEVHAYPRGMRLPPENEHKLYQKTIDKIKNWLQQKI